MRLITKTLPRDHNLFLFGDLHEGSVLFSEDGWYHFVETIMSEYYGCSNNYAIGHGDYMESIMIDDPRFHPDVTLGNPLIQMRAVVERLKVLKNQLLILLDGNHEYKLHRFGNIVQDMCLSLGVEYGTYSAHITYNDPEGNLMYKHFATHGSKSINSAADDVARQRANMELILKRHMKKKFGDCILNSKGHSHKLLVAPPAQELYLSVANNKINQHYKHSHHTDTEIHPDHKWYVNTGSFMRLYHDLLSVTGYAERWELDPVELGFCVAVVRDGEIRRIDRVVI